MTAKEIQPKKKSHEVLWTFIGLFVISLISAAYVINFRIKMKKFQVTPQEAQEILKQEKEFDKLQKTKVSPHRKPLDE